MVKKIDRITDLYAEAVREVSASPGNWMLFLRSACRNYRLPFDEQLLIYKQRPDAAAVLDMEGWNRKFGRWVKRDSKGIAVFDKSAGAMRLKYYFDVSDTKEGKYKRLVRPVSLWQIGERREEVRETLANAFGVSAGVKRLEETILETAKNAAEDNLTDYMQDILSNRKDSYLDGLDEYSVETEIKTLLANSIAYMVMVRCGIDAEIYLELEDFRNIAQLNTPELVNLFGSVNSDISGMVLSEISDTLRKLQLEERQEKKRTFAGDYTGQYNENKKSRIQADKEKDSDERRLNDGKDNGSNRIQTAGRLSSAKPDSARRTGNTRWEVRRTPAQLSEERTLRNIYKPADTGETEPTSGRDAEGSTGNDGAVNSRSERSAERDGRTEGKRSDVVAWDGKQHPAVGGRDRDEGTGVQLEDNTENSEEKTDSRETDSKENDRQLEWYDRSSEDKSIPFFGREADIKALLLSASDLKVSRAEVRAFYESHEDRSERIGYIQSIFSDDYTEMVLADERVVGYKVYQNVLHMLVGRYEDRSEQSFYDWKVIADYFEGMRLTGELRDQAEPLPTVGDQLELLNDLAGEQALDFSFSQELIDTVLSSGSVIQYGKYRIYSYFLQGHSRKEKADFLKNEYGIGGRSSVLAGTGIGEDHDSKGIVLHRGYEDEAPKILLKWSKVADRIDELIAVNRYMSEKELAGIPEYEKHVLAGEIYMFYSRQPENVVRPYTHGSSYELAIREIGLQLADTSRVEELLLSMSEMLDNTADFDQNYESMQKAYRNLMGYRDGTYSLFTPLPAERETSALPLHGIPSIGRGTDSLLAQTQEPAPVQESVLTQNSDSQVGAMGNLSAMHPPYDIDIGTTVWIGTDAYEIQFLSDDTVVLQDQRYPLFTKEMSREEFEVKLRENPANDYLKSKKIIPEPSMEEKEKPDAEELRSQGNRRGTEEEPAIEKTGEQERVPEVGGERKGGDKEEVPVAEKPQESVTEYKQDKKTVKSPAKPQRKFTAAHRNYRTMMELAPEVLRQEQESKRFEAGESFMPLTVEQIGENRIAVSHYFTENGDAFADPDMEFVVDHEAQTLNARTYQQDKLNRFDRVVVDGIVNKVLEKELNLFASQWFKNIREQGYQPAKEKYEPTPEDIPIGVELILEERKFAVDSVDADTGNVSLKDITFQEGTGFPIFRRESLQFVYDLLKEQEAQVIEQLQGEQDTKPSGGLLYEQETGITAEEGGDSPESLMPSWMKQRPSTGMKSFDLHPEIPQAERSQYRITNDELGCGGEKQKFRANIRAIQMLKKCEEENRYATPDEQEILAGYVGWGGLADAFDETKEEWGTEYLELKVVLTEEEYKSARESTLSAFYTPPVVIRAMYEALENMGLKSGNILEPSCGTGNFAGMKPESLSDCRIYGVEIDSISGRIAQQLYQKSTIAVQGFEEVNLPDSFFDVVIGNIPFGNYKVLDKKYDKLNFLIHDYFIAKSIDKIRPNGVLALVTSSGIGGGTMDKMDNRARKYIAEKCDMLGAIKLPNNAFLYNAGTDTNADILFFQKRESLRDLSTDMPEWIDAKKLYENEFVNTKGENRRRIVCINPYFQEHPEMVLGELEIVMGAYGPKLVCNPFPDSNLAELLKEAITKILAEIPEYETSEMVEEGDYGIPADLSVANFSYTVAGGRVYYRENSRMKLVDSSVTGLNRIKGMIAIRDCVRELIFYQTEGYSDREIGEQQKKLNQLYDSFQRKYGLLNARANSMVFSDDGSYPLLCSLEVLAEDGTLKRKADMFTKRTIKPHEAVTKVDTASEALSVSLAEKACVDMDYMCSLTGKSAEEIEHELSGVIFRGPEIRKSQRESVIPDDEKPQYVSEDEYLSGNVREKLKQARIAAQVSDIYKSNVEALEKVQPKDLTALEISVRLGATWIPETDVRKFMFWLLDTSDYLKSCIEVHFSKYTGEWNIEGKSIDKGNVKANNTYGTHRANAYKIMEDTLNLRDTRVYDYVEDEEGKRKAILNRDETAIAQGKQDLIKQAFQDWIWSDPERRQRLTKYYNEHFNAIRPREYDGSHLKFYGMNPEIQLRQHQVNGAARIIYGGNTLLAYVVGAGKTYTMVAAAMESRRLGLCSKSMVVVPNHIIEQFASEWLQLYPAANLLVATKKDFETKNRKKFCARIAASDVDAVIIGHSQFEKIPLSVERQQRTLEMQIAEVIDGISELKARHGSRFSVKQLERTKKSLETRLKKLNDQSRKDGVICFEELGIDRLFVDEADSYKNLYLYSKMRNVGGIAQTEAQKSSDMFMKCRYLDEITGGRGVVFATGTPVSNSMTELYTMQRYLQYPALVERNLQHFDAWASTFGETVTAIELAPEGSGYRMKTRFARFYNLPELMMMFREVADIQTADMLNLPVPEAEYRVVTVKPSEIQKEMVEELGNRAERIRKGMVLPAEDNMLLITNDGRKLALDQRLMNELLPDEVGSKVNACVEEVYRYWEQGKEKKLTQLLFSDLSTPKNDGSFSVYNDVRDKLIAKGIPKEEIAFIHEANTDVKKKELFAKVRNGSVRVLMGSTFKMGAGTNVQNLIIASHDLDCPWRPRDLEQRAGRTVRQGNQNKKVDIVRYVTEGTFDAYMFQMIESKQKFISQIMTSKSPARSVEDVDEAVLSYAEIKALAVGNPYVKEKMDLDIQVSKLQLLKQSFLSQRYEMEDKVLRHYPMEIKELEGKITAYQKDMELVRTHTPSDREVFPPMMIQNTIYSDKQSAGKAIIEVCKAMTSPDPVMIGSYRGLAIDLNYNTFSKEFVITLKGSMYHSVALGTDIHGNITRLDNKIAQFGDNLERCCEKLEHTKAQLDIAKAEMAKEFPREKELAEKTARLGELNALLDLDKKEKIVMDCEAEEIESEPEKNSRDRER